VDQEDPTDALGESTIGTRKPLVSSFKNEDHENDEGMMEQRVVSEAIEGMLQDSIFFKENTPRDLPEFSKEGKHIILMQLNQSKFSVSAFHQF
jgi:hypothetical protein